MGAVEREIRDRAGDSLAEIADLEIRSLFSGFGFYVDGMLVAAAWDGAFRLRHREDGHWRYRAVVDESVDDPAALVPLVLARQRALAHEPLARPRR